MSSKKISLGDNAFLSEVKDPLAWMKAEQGGSPATDTAYGYKKADNVVLIPIELIDPDPENFFNQKGIEELADSIEENGLLHPMVVRPIDGGRFKIISGERRWAAHKLLAERGNENFKLALCQVKEVDEIDAGISLIVANIEDRTVTPLEKIESIKRLSALINEKRARGEVKGKTRDLVGQIIGISGVEITRLNQVSNNLIPELKNALEEGKITLRSAIELSAKPPEYQQVISDKVSTEESYSTDDVKKIIEDVERKEEKKAETNMPKTETEKPACNEGDKWAVDMQKTVFQLDKQVQQLIRFKTINPEAFNSQKDRAGRLCQKVNELKETLENALIESALEEGTK